jgi:DNA-binding NtrC family response regulator
VRELENELARATALADGVIDDDVLSPRLATQRAPRPPTAQDDLALKPRVEALERELVEQALERTSGNQTAAARLLGLSRFGLQKKLKRYGISGSV